MTLPTYFFLTDLLQHRVRCDKGIDHGPGTIVWMHPPVHRILGWVSRPSSLRLDRDVWRLNQIKGIGEQQIYVKGDPSVSDQITIDRLPTLFNAEILNKNSVGIGKIADIFFNLTTGKISYYLISRTDPRIPGTSRWRLNIDKIVDQQPGMISSNISTLDDIPLLRSSIRQDFLKRSKYFREQIQEISDKASNRLEGWLEDSSWNEGFEPGSKHPSIDQEPSIDDWIDDFPQEPHQNNLESISDFSKEKPSSIDLEESEDPWI